ncbi:MAG: hypothetical protein RIE22_01960 [Alphaproteobacteria bacterium]
MNWLNRHAFGASLWANRQPPPDVIVTPGQMFRHTHPDHTVETAQVHGLSKDAQGIPHVHFSVEYFRTRGSLYREGPRALALDAFAARYGELVTN